MKTRLFAAENRKWWTLAAVAVGLFMIMLDNTVVNVALPSIQQDLGVSPSELEWVVNAYALTFGVLLLSGEADWVDDATLEIAARRPSSVPRGDGRGLEFLLVGSAWPTE
ncbi:MAG TPA: hypothetical protein VFM83_11015 [Gaiellaceae bacterium]|nr:hypothetical protein [Gaiellaceae bacterium]